MNKNKEGHYRLGHVLLCKNLITSEQLESALAVQRSRCCKLGEALIELGYISQAQLNQALAKQSYLRTWAACLALLAPSSICFAYDPLEHEWTSHQITPEEQWPHMQDIDLDLRDIKPNMYGQALSSAWALYQGAPEQGKWRYSLGKTRDQTGYQVKFRLSF